MDQSRYRWFRLSLAAGGLLAILLLVNSIVDYVFISHRIMVSQVRHEMSKQVLTLERQLRNTPSGGKAQLAALTEELRKEHKIAWIHIRDREGSQLTHAGLEVEPSFSAQQIHSALANHEPITRVRRTAAGTMVVEAFGLHLPPKPNHPGPPSFASVEIGMSLDSASAQFWPLRQSLIINCSAALALVTALIVIALRLPSYLEGRRLEQELDIARQVQRDLLPEPCQRIRNANYAAEFVPAAGVGGDFYDAFPVNGHGAAFVLGDVSGKGMPAALLMGVLHGAVRSSSWMESARRHEECSQKLNRLLCERASGARYASMFWSYYDAGSETLRYINAGHCPPLLVRKRHGRSSIEKLEEGGPVLGLLPGARYEQAVEAIGPDDLLLLYSDGVVEAANTQGEEFGEDRLIEVVDRSSERSVDEIRREIVAAVQAFTAPHRPHDDVTLVVVRFDSVAQLSGQDTAQPAMEVVA